MQSEIMNYANTNALSHLARLLEYLSLFRHRLWSVVVFSAGLSWRIVRGFASLFASGETYRGRHDVRLGRWHSEIY